jgi:hypothetical protein
MTPGIYQSFPINKSSSMKPFLFHNSDPQQHKAHKLLLCRFCWQKNPSYVLKPSLQRLNKAWRADHHAAHCPGSSIPHTLAPGEKETGLRPRESEERASPEKTTCGGFVVRACVMVMERERERRKGRERAPNGCCWYSNTKSVVQYSSIQQTLMAS